MTKSPMPLVDSSMVAPLVAIGNVYFGFVISEYLLFSLLTVSSHCYGFTRSHDYCVGVCAGGSGDLLYIILSGHSQSS